ncbi:MAG: BamA/TamA family outer membrane protein [Bacteroidetes bacterium]|nr:BamA/TamA family outer membrane protein [Bacteroidota bacterium]
MRKSQKIRSILIALIILTGCNTTRYLKDTEHLLIKNRIRIEKKGDTGILPGNDVIAEYIRQKPNRKLFGLFRFHLWIYNISTRGKVTEEIKKIVGEPPVIIDERSTKESVRQIKRFLQSKGFFHAGVKDSIIFKKKKGIAVYSIIPGNPYYVGNVKYTIVNPAILQVLGHESASGLVRNGMPWDEDLFQQEREAITRKLKNSGYYSFSRESVRFIADSLNEPGKINLEIEITGPDGISRSDASKAESHKKYSIEEIYVHHDFNPVKTGIIPRDTLAFGMYRLLGSGKFIFKTESVLSKIPVKKGDTYSLEKSEDTYKYLSGLKVFKFINIQYRKREPDTADIGKLDCIVQLSPHARQSFAFETEGTNSSQNYGMAGNLVYRNNNLFRGAELFEFKIMAAMETQKTINEDEGNEAAIVEPIPFFNTLEVGPETGIFFPGFLSPVFRKKMPLNTRTVFSAAYNFLSRPDFTRSMVRGSMGYEWSSFIVRKSISERHLLQPVNINVIGIDPDSSFLKKLNTITNAYIRNSYSDHLISSSLYMYTFTDIKKLRPFVYFKCNFELAGNLLRLFSSLSTEPDAQSGSYPVFNIKFAQYVRSEADYRFYMPLNRHNIIATRIYAGAGIPYGNLRDKKTGFAAMPFEKSFFGGGTNDIRAWYSRSLGPGSYFDTLEIDRIGDIKMTGNFEYRADIYKMFKVAFFVDAGNIWLMVKDTSRDNAHFDAKRFIGEWAVGSGIGLRLDPGFFILRIDLAYKLKIPEAPPGERWIFEPKEEYNKLRKDPYKTSPTLNLAIGYPF